MPIDEQRLRSQGSYEVGLPLQAILADIAEIADVLQNTEAKRKQIRLVSGLVALVFIVLAIATGLTESGAIAFLAFLAFASALTIFIYSFVYGRSLHRHRARFELLKQRVQSIQQDADKRATFQIKLAFKEQRSLIREEPFPQRKNGKQKFFEEEYLTIQGEMLDGTTLRESLTELTRERTYKNPRGKIKTKIRKRYLVAVRLDYPTDLYGDARPAQEALKEEIQLPSSATLRDLRVSEKAIAAKVQVDLEDEVAQTCGMVTIGAYRILNLARRVAAGGAA